MRRSGSCPIKVLCGVGLSVVPIGGCFTLQPSPDFDSALPQDRFLAIREAKRQRDAGAVDDLIRQLSSDDVLIRVAAIDALEAITGQRLGFEADAPEADRVAAVADWLDWRDREGTEGPIGFRDTEGAP